MDSKMKKLNRDIEVLEEQLRELKAEKAKANRELGKDKIKKVYDLLQEVAELEWGMVRIICNGDECIVSANDIEIECDGTRLCLYGD